MEKFTLGIFINYIVVKLICSYLIANYIGRHRSIGFWPALLLSIILVPLGLLAALGSRKIEPEIELK